MLLTPAIVAFALAAAAPQAGMSPPIVVIPPESETASVAVAHLKGELGSSLEVVIARALDMRATELARGSPVLVIDPDRNEVSLFRRGDEAALVRRLPPQSRGSALALAIAAAELVRLANAEPAASPPPPPLYSPPSPPPLARSLDRALALSIGLGFAIAPGAESFALPVFGADFFLGSKDWASAIGARVRGPGSTSERAGEVLVEYRRIDLSGRIAFGPELDRLRILGVLEAGASFAEASASAGSVVLGESSRAPFWFGGGVEASYFVWEALAVTAAISLAAASSPADYVGNGALVFSEGDLRVQTALGLSWFLEFR